MFRVPFVVLSLCEDTFRHHQHSQTLFGVVVNVLLRNIIDLPLFIITVIRCEVWKDRRIGTFTIKNDLVSFGMLDDYAHSFSGGVEREDVQDLKMEELVIWMFDVNLQFQ